MIRRKLPKPVTNDFNASMVVGGFFLSLPGSGLVPLIAVGLLYAQGQRYAPASAPTLPALSATAGMYYLFFNSTTGFYWATSATPTTAGDCPVGTAVVASGAIASVQTYLIFDSSLPPASSGGGASQVTIGETSGAGGGGDTSDTTIGPPLAY